MRKIIAAINITLDGSCDHTAMIADEEIHDHYTGLVNGAGALLYGRTTYQLMESFWPAMVKHPSGDPSMDAFARAIQKVPKIVFSHTLKEVNWENTRLAELSLAEEITALRQQSGADVFIGSPGLIDQLTQLHLIDEYQLCVHPVISGGGSPLFKTTRDHMVLMLIKTHTFSSGAVLHSYEPLD